MCGWRLSGTQEKQEERRTAEANVRDVEQPEIWWSEAQGNASGSGETALPGRSSPSPGPALSGEAIAGRTTNPAPQNVHTPSFSDARLAIQHTPLRIQAAHADHVHMCHATGDREDEEDEVGSGTGREAMDVDIAPRGGQHAVLPVIVGYVHTVRRAARWRDTKAYAIELLSGTTRGVIFAKAYATDDPSVSTVKVACMVGF